MLRIVTIAVPTLLLLTGCDAFTAVGEGTRDELAKQEAAAASENLNEAQRAFADANARMHSGMTDAIPADADEAFMRGMIPHHQGAVDMAEIALKHGKDPEVRALATAVIAAQKAEIAQMETWLKARGVATDPVDGDTPADHSAMGH